ncbi:MAG: hypothetical protein IKY29_02925, partial [Clostridia bacterium]|nr:hypothetical protein [Clostridia bacterium]
MGDGLNVAVRVLFPAAVGVFERARDGVFGRDVVVFVFVALFILGRSRLGDQTVLGKAQLGDAVGRQLVDGQRIARGDSQISVQLGIVGN